LLFVVWPLVSANAQTPTPGTSIQQMENFNQTTALQKPLSSLKAGTNAPEIYQGENADIGPQHILRLMPRRTLIEVMADTKFFYTDNALLSQKTSTPGSAPVPGSVWVNTIQAAIAPTPYKIGYGRFAPSAGFINQWYNYWNDSDGAFVPDLTKIDFVAQTFFAKAKYIFPDDWEAYGEFDFDRLLSQQNYSEFYRDYVPKVGVTRLFQINDNLILSAGLSTDYRFTRQVNPPHHALNRWDDDFSTALNYQITPKFGLQPYYRLEFSRYDFNTAGTVERKDLLNSFGLSASYFFTPAFSLRAYVNYDVKVTSDTPPSGATPSYQDYSVGVDLSYTLRF